MAITAQRVKELRTRTGVGMMECKRALSECNGDLDAAVEHLRKGGQMEARKRAGRIAAEGVIVHAGSSDRAVLVEVNSETDFVAKDEGFLAFAQSLADTALASKVANVEALMSEKVNGKTCEEQRQQLIARIGENIQVRRLEWLESGSSSQAYYLHGHRIGVLIVFEGGDAELGRDVAMHVAANRPVCVDESGVPAELLASEREMLSAQAASSGKPPEIIEKMVDGRLRKYLAEITLVGQPFVKDQDQTVGALLKSKGASIKAFVRLEVGEGIEKKQENFAEEVRSQVESS